MGFLKHTGSYTWDGLDILRYKEDGNHFKDITRQILYPGCPDLPVQFRYFEIGPGGHSTLERHHHVHAIRVIRGSGEALVDGVVRSLKMFDVVEIPGGAWHQFRATAGEAFGILCLVREDRDRPELPDEEQLKEIRRNPELAAFIRA